MTDQEEAFSPETYRQFSTTIEELRGLYRDTLYQMRRDQLRLDTIKSVMGPGLSVEKNGIQMLTLYSRLVIIDQEKLESIIALVDNLNTVSGLIPAHLRSAYSISKELVQEQAFAEAEKAFDREGYIRFLESDDEDD